MDARSALRVAMIRRSFVLATLLATGCFRYSERPAAPTPAHMIPVVDEVEPAADGMTPVTLDLAQGHALAQEVDVTGTTTTTTLTTHSETGRWSGEARNVSVSVAVTVRDDEHAHALCLTPCVANLAPGPHTIRFMPLADLGPDAVDDKVGFDVGRRPLVVRAQLKEDSPPKKVGTILLYMLATGLVVGGTTSLAFGSEQEPGWFVGGGVSIGLGVVAGIVGFVVDAATIGHRRRGAATSWEPSGPSYVVKRP